MLISLNWLKEYVDINISDDELVTLIGARLVEVEGVIDNRHKYDKIYAVKVVRAEKIEGTHLTRCLIDDGKKASDVERDENGFIQAMCGAPNVHEGMFAAWIAPGAIVPATVNDAEPFKIGMRKMLGKYDSYGMMAGADELDLGDDHSGIVELDPESTNPGDDFAKLFNLDDQILDIENKSLTHRPDTFGIIGFAREVAGILGQKFQTPDWFKKDIADFALNSDLKLNIEIADEKLCSRYTAVVLRRGKFEEKHYLSRQDTLLARSGMRPIDPIVDVTNYLMLLTGQPLHAFDYDKFIAIGKTENPKILVRAAKNGEKITLLDDKEIELNSDDIVITSNDIPVALAGAMGGKNTEIDENTSRVILESATFSLYNLRKTQMAHGIFSEAITRFTKGQPAGQTVAAAMRADEMLDELETEAIFDAFPGQKSNEAIRLEISQLNNLLGTEFSTDEAKNILENVEFAVEIEGDALKIATPFWRTDIHIPEDLIEEVGRLSGFDNITPRLPLHATATKNPLLELKKQIRNSLAHYGANEVLTYSFVHGDLLEKVGQNPENSYKIINSISPELQYIRQSLVSSLLDKSYMNIRAGYEKFVLFEMNQTYEKSAKKDQDGVPMPSHHLAALFIDGENSNFYLAKHYLETLLEKLGVEFEIQAPKDTENYFEPLRSANIVAKNGEKLGTLGEIKTKVLRGFKLSPGIAAFELNLEKLLANKGTSTKNFKFSNFPSVFRDATFEVAADSSYDELVRKIEDILKTQNIIYGLTCTSIYRPENSDKKRISFHFEFKSPEKTLTKNEIQAIMDTIEKI